MRARTTVCLMSTAACLAGILFPAFGAARIETIAGTGRTDDTGGLGPALKPSIGWPFGVEHGPDAALHITACLHHRVLRLDPKTRRLTIVAGNGRAGYSGDGGPATQASLNQPYEVRFTRADNLFFVEIQNHIVRRIDAKTGVITTVAGTGERGFAGDGGSARSAQLSVPHSIVVDNAGGVFIADIGNHRIRYVNPKSGVISTIAGTGEIRTPEDGAQADGSPLPGPRTLAIEDTTLWIILREGHSLWKMNLENRRLYHAARTGEAGYTGDGSAAQHVTFNGPKGIAIGPDSDIYIVDSGNDCIRRMNRRTHIVTTIAGSGLARSWGGDGGDPRRAKLSQPHGICVAPDGIISFCDTLNHRVRTVIP